MCAKGAGISFNPSGMTKEFEASAKEKAEEQWQSFVEDKACCTEHAIKHAFVRGARWGRDAGLEEAAGIAEDMHSSLAGGQQIAEAIRAAKAAR